MYRAFESKHRAHYFCSICTHVDDILYDSYENDGELLPVQIIGLGGSEFKFWEFHGLSFSINVLVASFIQKSLPCLPLLGRTQTINTLELCRKSSVEINKCNAPHQIHSIL